MENKSLLINDILKIVPHRYPLLLIDKVVSYEEFKTLNAVKNVTINEPFFTGHFPDNPIMPGVLILEALAQASVALANLSLKADNRRVHMFAGVDKARFKSIVRPGDVLNLTVEITKQKRDIWIVRGTATVDNILACSAQFMSSSKQF